MSKKLYISDLHLRHFNVIRFDNRPWHNIESMERDIINNWNSVVNKGDDVYVLGDFIWSGKNEEWIEIINQLNGNIHLVLGNHDKQNMSQQLRKKFKSISNYKEVKDNGKRVLLSHYPIPFYRGAYDKDIVHLYGHIHTTIENNFMEHLRDYIDRNDNRDNAKHKGQFYNVGCMMPYMNYTPRTLDEILEAHK